MSTTFQPRRAIVTGADSGIGKATAVQLAHAGCDVAITWHEDADGARATADEIAAAGRAAELAQLDLLARDAVQPTVAELADRLGGVDVLVNNAGTGHSAPFLDVALDDWDRVLAVDLTGAFLAGQAAARRMVDDGRPGRIINVTSIHEHVPLRGSAAYCAAKGGLGLLTQVMALELAPHGITVNAIAPGEIATPMTGAEDEDPRTIERPAIPVGRPGDAHEVAAAIAWLASPHAAYATGQSFVIDGGLLLMAAVANQDAR